MTGALFSLRRETGFVQRTRGQVLLLMLLQLNPLTPLNLSSLELEEQETGESCSPLVLPYAGTEFFVETTHWISPLEANPHSG